MNAIDKAMQIASSTEEEVKELDFGNVWWALGVLAKERADTVCISRQELEAMRKNPDNHQHMQTGGGRYTYTLGFNDCIDKLLEK